MVRSIDFDYRLSELVRVGQVGSAMSCALFAVLTVLLTFSCSKKNVTSTTCKADEIKQDGECVKKSANNTPGPPAIDPTAVGDTVSSRLVSYDLDSATFSVSLANLGLLQDEQNSLSGIHKVLFIIESQIWTEERGILQAVRSKTVIGSDNKSPDCTVLPDGDAATKRKELPAIIQKVGNDVTIKFVKTFAAGELQHDDKSLGKLKRWLGLNSYQMDDIRVTAGVAGLSRDEDPTIHVNLWGAELKHYKLVDQDKHDAKLCFKKLYAKQDSSLNDKEPSSSAKIFPYKEVKYSEVKKTNGTSSNKPYNYEYKFQKSNNEYVYNLYQYQEVKFKIYSHNKPIRKASTDKPLTLSLPGAAYLINSSTDHREEGFTGRAAPSEDEFVRTMSALLRALAE